MRIARFVVDNDPMYGVVEGESGSEIVTVIKGDPFFNGVERTAEKHPLADVRLVAPIIPRSKVIGVGRNFAEHARELGNEVPESPLLFLKPNTSVVGPNEPIVLPEFSEEVSYEAELCVVIGRICKDVPEERVDEVIFGYTCGNDLTARDVQAGDGQWARAKGFDTAAPLGPWIETELDPDDVYIKGWLNGELRQDGSSNQMVRSVRELVSLVSHAFTLLPGDVIMTGTPAGVDLTARDVQAGDGQWARAKGFDTAAPLGPWIETELDPDDVYIKGWLNGELRQDGSSNQMVRSVRELVSLVSHAFTLLPGDVIMTGTPAGVDLLQAGDRYDVEIEGIGRLSNPVVRR